MSRNESHKVASAVVGIAVLVLVMSALPASAIQQDFTGLYGGSLRVAVMGPIALNPFTATDADSWKVIPLVYDSLGRIDPTSLRPVPWAAESWSIAGPNLTATLRSDLKFHDGSAVTAADVVYSYGQYRTLGIAPSDLAVASSGRTVTLSSATGGGLLFGHGLMLPIVKGGTGITNAPIGSGPWIPPASVSMPLSLSANTGHFWRPYLDQVTFSTYANTTTAAKALLTGNVDFIGWTLGVDEPSAIIDVGGGVNKTLLSDATVVQNAGLTNLVVGFNMRASRATSADGLRLALAKTLNPILFKQIYPSTRISRSPVIQENGPWFNPNVQVYQVTLNAFPRTNVLLTESLQLLDKNGYLDRNSDGFREAPTGLPLSLTVVGIPVDENARTFTIQAAAVANFNLLGIDATLVSEPSATILARLAAGNYDVFIASLDSTLDPGFLWDYLHSSGARNYFGVTDTTLDGYLVAANAALDTASRQSSVNQIQARTMTRGFMIPALHFNAIEATVRGGLDGWVNMPGGVNNFWTYQSLHATQVGELTADLTLVPNALRSGQQTAAIARVVDQDGAPVAGVTTSFWIGGTQVASGTTNAAGSVNVSIAAPAVDGTTDFEVSVRVTRLGYTGALATTVMTVRPDTKTLTVAVTSDKVTVASGRNAAIAVTVSAGGQPVAGAAVSLEVIGLGGGVAQAKGTTDSQGRFTTTFSGDVGPRTQFRIVATGSLDGYTDGQGSTTVVVEQRVGTVEPRAAPGLDVGTIVAAILALAVIAGLVVWWGSRRTT